MCACGHTNILNYNMIMNNFERTHKPTHKDLPIQLARLVASLEFHSNEPAFNIFDNKVRFGNPAYAERAQALCQRSPMLLGRYLLFRESAVGILQTPNLEIDPLHRARFHEKLGASRVQLNAIGNVVLGGELTLDNAHLLPQACVLNSVKGLPIQGALKAFEIPTQQLT